MELNPRQINASQAFETCYPPWMPYSIFKLAECERIQLPSSVLETEAQALYQHSIKMVKSLLSVTMRSSGCTYPVLSLTAKSPPFLVEWERVALAKSNRHISESQSDALPLS